VQTRVHENIPTSPEGDMEHTHSRARARARAHARTHTRARARARAFTLATYILLVIEENSLKT